MRVMIVSALLFVSIMGAAMIVSAMLFPVPVPWRFVTAALAGIFASGGAYWHLRDERESAWIVLTFIGGLAVYGYGFWGLLHWSFTL